MNSAAPSVVAKPEPASATAGGSETDLATLLDEPESHAWYRRPTLLAGAALLIVAALGAWYWQTLRTANAAPSYTTQIVGRGNLTLTVTANGTLQPTRSIAIGSELSGTVLKVNVDVNDRIRKGQVLVELDTSKLHDQILRSRASLAAANAKVAQTVATVKEAQATLGRFEEVARLSGGKGGHRVGAVSAASFAACQSTDVCDLRGHFWYQWQLHVPGRGRLAARLYRNGDLRADGRSQWRPDGLHHHIHCMQFSR